jgi:uncharacterized membrane protein YeaQ/YmgE (transglycosylase-associated protein family)
VLVIDFELIDETVHVIHLRGHLMKKMLGFIGATVGGGIGWWAGAPVGTMTAFMLSIVGTGLGIYVGKRLADRMES